MKILTFDIEDWYHILDNPLTKGPNEWKQFESRIDIGMDTIFRILEGTNCSATFFIVGWVAKEYPHVVKRIIDAGYEIGSHTNVHQLVYTQNQTEFAEDLKTSINTIEDIAGEKVTAFRAPGFSVTKNTPWFFESLLNNGIQIDCSIFPASRSHGGFAEFQESVPTRLLCKGMTLKEFPINTHSILGKDIIFSGGGYFRLLPNFLIKRFSDKSEYVMSYFHPRDFDDKQPMVPGLNWIRKFKSYYGLSRTEQKLLKWMNRENFLDLSQADSQVDWRTTNIIEV